MVDVAISGEGERGKSGVKQPPIDAGLRSFPGFRSVHDQVFRDG
jgi:hypothetical protein